MKVYDSKTYRVATGCGKMIVTISYDEDGIHDVMAKLGKVGGCAASQTEAISRLCHMLFTHKVGIADVVKQLKGINCHMGNSCSDAVAEALLKFKEFNEKTIP